MKLDNTLYTASVTATGGRDNGNVISTDQQLDIKIGRPAELGGDGQSGTNPEQLFAAGYAACFIGAMGVVAQRLGLALPENTSIDSKVALGSMGEVYGIAAHLQVNLPGLDQATAESLVNAAHQVCPYSNATRGNIEVELSVNTET